MYNKISFVEWLVGTRTYFDNSIEYQGHTFSARSLQTCYMGMEMEHGFSSRQM